MCGFSGYVAEFTSKETIKKMNDLIIHRGPDDEGYYVDENIAMGFRRLSIIDVACGHQPMFNQDNSLVITFNGEIYNHKEIRKDLEEKGYIFNNNSDTEVIVYGYDEYGVDILNKLRGMFAFVIWDKKKKRLFGARDHFGIKPFYYYKKDDIFMYGSEIKSFLGNDKFKKELNKSVLKPYLVFQYSPTNETFFKDVYKLESGHYFIYENGNLDIKEYYDFNYPKNTKFTYEEAKEELKKQITSSVNYHKDSEVKVGSFLSAGVDSSYIASELRPEKTFTVGFDKEALKKHLSPEEKYNLDNFNEITKASALCDVLGIKNEHKYITPDEFFDALPKVQYHSDEPHANLSSVALYFLSALAREHVTVVQSGEGADELFAGYHEYVRRLSLDKYMKIPKAVRKGVYNIVKNLPNFKGKSFLVEASKDIEEYYIGQAKIFSDEDANNILKNDYRSSIKSTDITKKFYDKVKDKSDLEKMQYVDMHLWLQNDILLKADKMTMANSIELRVPLLDKEMFEFAGTLKDDYKIKDGIGKRILREASEDVIPKEWSNRTKLGFNVPFVFFIREEKYYNKVKDLLNEEFVAEFFEQDKLLNMLEKHYKKEANYGRKIYTVISFLTWYKEYFINR